jgi:hypothetical protein
MGKMKISTQVEREISGDIIIFCKYLQKPHFQSRGIVFVRDEDIGWKNLLRITRVIKKKLILKVSEWEK